MGAWETIKKGADMVGELWNRASGKSSAYQITAEDMKNAGLNQGMMYGSGGESMGTPGSAGAMIGAGSNIIGSLLNSAAQIIKQTNQKDYNERKLAAYEKNTAERYRDKQVTNQLYDKSGKLISTAETLIKSIKG